jgi:RNA polymerase sigma factor (sigma-70 family)
VTKLELKNYRWLKIRNRTDTDRLTVLQSKAEFASTALSLAPGKGEASGWEAIVCKIADMTLALQARMLSELELTCRIETAIANLPEPERDLMRLRYIDGKTWERIAVDLNYSWQHLHKIHAKTLRKLENY